MNILVLNGPNLNLLGTRNPDVYGSTTLEDINNMLSTKFPTHEFEFFQSNVEGELTNRIQSSMKDGTEAIIGKFWRVYAHLYCTSRCLGTNHIPKS